MFKPGFFYTHNRMLDAAVLVVDSVRNEDSSLSLSVWWFNQRGLDLGIPERIIISPKEASNWNEISL